MNNWSVVPAMKGRHRENGAGAEFESTLPLSDRVYSFVQGTYIELGIELIQS